MCRTLFLFPTPNSRHKPRSSFGHDNPPPNISVFYDTIVGIDLLYLPFFSLAFLLLAVNQNTTPMATPPNKERARPSLLRPGTAL